MTGKQEKAKETDNTEVIENWLDNHDLDELIETTNMKILPKYEIIVENDLITSRKVIINSLPKKVFVEKANQDLEYMTIIDSGIKYSLPFNSKALQRSLISLAIKESKAKTRETIDMSKVLGKMYIIKRKQFTSKSGFTTAPLSFFPLSE